MRKLDLALQTRLATIIQSMGFELLGGEIFPQGGKSVFRLYIDSPKGVTIDDCSRVSHQVSAILDVEDPIHGRYHLEVSSPGINRPLFEMEHFRKYMGSRVKIRLKRAINNKRQYQGILQRVEGDTIYLLVEGVEPAVMLPFAEIEKANLIGDVHL